MEVDNFIKRMAKVDVHEKKIWMNGYQLVVLTDFVQNGSDDGFQATGVAITEVRDAGREENGQGGAVRRLALNRCLLGGS